jgi:hypothetical protein
MRTFWLSVGAPLWLAASGATSTSTSTSTSAPATTVAEPNANTSSQPELAKKIDAAKARIAKNPPKQERAEESPIPLASSPLRVGREALLQRMPPYPNATEPTVPVGDTLEAHGMPMDVVSFMTNDSPRVVLEFYRMFRRPGFPDDGRR